MVLVRHYSTLKNIVVCSFVLLIQFLLVKAIFTVTVFEILLFEGRSVISPTHRGTGTERVDKIVNLNCSLKIYINYTASKLSVLGIFLVHIFPHSDGIRRDTRIQSECGKIRTRKTPNRDAFQAVLNQPISGQFTLLYLLKGIGREY